MVARDDRLRIDGEPSISTNASRRSERGRTGASIQFGCPTLCENVAVPPESGRSLSHLAHAMRPMTRHESMARMSADEDTDGARDLPEVATAEETATSALRGAILRGSLAPGQRL